MVRLTAELKKRQETPDSAEALATIPSLTLADIPREVSTVPTAIRSVGGAQVLSHDLFTNDVLYVEAALDMRGVPQHLLPLLPLFARYEARVLGGRCSRAVRRRVPKRVPHAFL